ncbi:hypothetical protein IU440_28930 [Nocardia cyriacigeorgica]|uniref:hypothetical protein n=1 Tax=Nocardia cyriacigeorgica TaxID=135487 RepID=UPI0018950D51|nr:hypothetical protein [Nocardia cyriacigeorgica]MBF6428702.1 hypothetical protein [Nocardia cyriacigeorgica]
MAISFDIDTDLRPFEPNIDPAKAAIMITDALAMAEALAPCVFEPGFTKEAAAKAIIRGAILRWNDQGSGAAVQKSQTAGPFSQSETVDTRQTRKVAFWPSEITDLQGLCSGSTTLRAFTVDTYPVEVE